MMRLWIALAYGIGGIVCLISAFSTKGMAIPAGSLLFIAGIALSIISFWQLTGQQRHRLIATVISVGICVFVLYCIGCMVFFIWGPQF